MNTTYRNALASYGRTLITHIGLIGDGGTEISGGSYVRKAITWTAASDGSISPTADLVFNIPAGVTIREWRGYTAATAGTDYGGAAMAPFVSNTPQTYTLRAVATGIDHRAG